MTRFPVRVAAGRLKPSLAQEFPWRCKEHVAAGTKVCVEECCGACYWLAPDEGCQLGVMRPMRCQIYPLIPQRDRVIVHRTCPEARHFIESLEAGDARAHALLDVAVAMTDIIDDAGYDNSMEVDWLLSYTQDGFGGYVVWRRGAGVLTPDVKERSFRKVKEGKRRRNV